MLWPPERTASGQFPIAGELHSSHDVRSISGADNQAREAIVVTVPDAPGAVIRFRTGHDDLAGQTLAKAPESGALGVNRSNGPRSASWLRRLHRGKAMR